MKEKAKIIIVDSDDNSRNIIKSYSKNLESAEFLAEFDNYNAACDFIATQGDCIVLFDISSQSEQDVDTKSLTFISTIKNINKNALIIAMSNKTETSNIIKALRAGASEFLAKPLTQTGFSALLNDLVSVSDNEENACKIISTFSNKGGIGKTSIAVNLSVEIAQMTKEKVALIDLNLQLGDVSTFMDLNPAFDIAYLVKNLDNMDDTTLVQSLTRYKNSSLYVIADPINIETSKEINAEQIQKLIARLKKIFSYIIIDIGTSIDAKTITALDLSNLILLIAIVNLPAIRNMQRCMNLFDKLNYPSEKIRLVLNRYMDNDEIKTSDIEDVVKQKVYWKIPNNYLTMMSAINKGVPVNEINSDSNIAVNYKDFASKLCDYLITQKLHKNLERVKII